MCPQIRKCAGKCHLSENQFFLLVYKSANFQNKHFCTLGQNVASLDCLVRSSYPQLHGVVNLTQILQGGLEIVLLSWWTFPLTDCTNHYTCDYQALHLSIFFCFQPIFNFFNEMLTHCSLPPTFTFITRGFDALNQSKPPTKLAIFEGHPLREAFNNNKKPFNP